MFIDNDWYCTPCGSTYLDQIANPVYDLCSVDCPKDCTEVHDELD